MKENRTDARFDICLTARWQGSAVNQDVRICDLSNGGCYLDTIAGVSVGETLFLKILMPDGDWVELQGVVAHQTPRLGFGVRFVNLNEAQRHQIRSLLRIDNSSWAESDASDYSDALISLAQIDPTFRIMLKDRLSRRGLDQSAMQPPAPPT